MASSSSGLHEISERDADEALALMDDLLGVDFLSRSHRAQMRQTAALDAFLHATSRFIGTSDSEERGAASLAMELGLSAVRDTASLRYSLCVNPMREALDSLQWHRPKQAQQKSKRRQKAGGRSPRAVLGAGKLTTQNVDSSNLPGPSKETNGDYEAAKVFSFCSLIQRAQARTATTSTDTNILSTPTSSSLQNLNDLESAKKKKPVKPSLSTSSTSIQTAGNGNGAYSSQQASGARRSTSNSTINHLANSTAPTSSAISVVNRKRSAGKQTNSTGNHHQDDEEQTYCICDQVSFGEMIGCDNADCVIEWFHFSCVGLRNKPKGKWYCPDCRDSNNATKMKRLK